MALDKGRNTRPTVRCRRRRIGRFVLRCMLLLPVLFPPVTANQLRSLNLEELAGRANRIFTGRVLAVRVHYDRDLGQHVTATTLVVERSLKGDLSGQITIRTLGGRPGGDPPTPGPSDRARAVRGMPRFDLEEKVVLFLYEDSPIGLTSPVGFGQGKFTIVEDGKKGPLAVNGFDNSRLTRNLSDGASRRIGARTSTWPDEGAVPLDEFLETIDAILDRNARGRSP